MRDNMPARMKDSAALRRRIRTRDVRVVVVGQGYVGLSVAAAAAMAGMTVHGVDSDAERVAALAAGDNAVPGVADATFSLAVDTGRLHFTTDISVVAGADIVLVCVPTPVVELRPDLSAIEAATRSVAAHLPRGSLVVLESTTYPGTTDSVVRPLLEAHGLRCGRDFLLAFSPERIDPGNHKYGLQNTPRIVGGSTPDATATAAEFYGQLVTEVVAVTSCRAAELAKLLENTFRMVNIALVNELAMLCAEQGIDTWEVIRAAASKPFGFMPFQPGPGVGGHCIPLDPTYLAWQSRRDTGKPFRIVELARDINAQMPGYVAVRIVEALNARGKSVKDARILALGVTYKPNVGDIRESAAITVLEQLTRKGAKVAFHDPYVARVDRGPVRLRRTALTDEAIARADCVVVLTPHDSYDLGHVVERAQLVFDARNVVPRTHPDRVVPL
jgi:UDP-N-acetyl-D-glucosamine dehydrogenase